MTRHFAPSPITTDAEHFLFAGPKIDPFVADSEPEARRHAEYLDSDKQDYRVVRFNAVDGTCRDVTHEFLTEAEEEDEIYPVIRWIDWKGRDAR